MKITRTITIDSEIWAKAKNKTDSLSGTINELLKMWIKNASDKPNIKELDRARLKITELETEISIKTDTLEKYKTKVGDLDDDVVQVLTRKND